MFCVTITDPEENVQEICCDNADELCDVLKAHADCECAVKTMASELDDCSCADIVPDDGDELVIDDYVPECVGGRRQSCECRKSGGGCKHPECGGYCDDEDEDFMDGDFDADGKDADGGRIEPEFDFRLKGFTPVIDESLSSSVSNLIDELKDAKRRLQDKIEKFQRNNDASDREIYWFQLYSKDVWKWADLAGKKTLLGVHPYEVVMGLRGCPKAEALKFYNDWQLKKYGDIKNVDGAAED